MIAHCVPKSERVENILPVGAPKDKRPSVNQLILNKRVLARIPRIEMNVFNTPNIISRIDELGRREMCIVDEEV